MTASRTITLSRPAVAPDALGFFRFGLVGGKHLLTTDAGDWCFLEPGAFEAFLAGRIDEKDPKHAMLIEKGLLRAGLDQNEMAARIRRRKDFLGRHPLRHTIAVTRRARRGGDGLDMSPATAKKVVDFAMKHGPGPMVFEITGGDPSLDPAVVKFVVEYVREKNRYERRPIRFELRTAFEGMTPEIAGWLAQNRVLVRTGLDGEEALHDGQRQWTGRGSFAETARWIREINRCYSDAGLDPAHWHVHADPIITRRSFDGFEDIAAAYVALGIRSLRLRPLQAWEVGEEGWRNLGYPIHDYVSFYGRALDHLIGLGKAGTGLAEETATIFAAKALPRAVASAPDQQSPCSAGTGELSYDVDGRIYPDDESRRIAVAGDEIFCLGAVEEATPEGVRGHPSVRALATASLQDVLPACNTCWNNAFCFVTPVLNYRLTGDVFGQRPRSPECAEHMGVSGHIFSLLRAADAPAIESVLRRWIDRAYPVTASPSSPEQE